YRPLARKAVKNRPPITTRMKPSQPTCRRDAATAERSRRNSKTSNSAKPTPSSTSLVRIFTASLLPARAGARRSGGRRRGRRIQVQIPRRNPVGDQADAQRRRPQEQSGPRHGAIGIEDERRKVGISLVIQAVGRSRQHR